MIITKKVKLKIHSRNKKRIDLKYNINTKKGDIIDADISDLEKNSKNKIKVECDFCNNIVETTYQTYLNSHENGGFPCSQKCINEKIKKTKKEKYGDKNYCNVDKIRKTKLDRYDDEKYNNNEKNKKTNLEKYGVEYYSQTDEFNIKVKKTNLEKYGVEYYSQTNDFVKKVKETKTKRYDDENYNNRKKYKKTCLVKYGVETFVLSDYYNENVNRKSYSQNKYFDFYKDDFYKKYNIKIIDYVDKHFICKCKNKNHTYKILPDTLKKRLEIHKVDPCTICNNLNGHISAKEIELVNFIKNNYDDVIITSDRKILNPYELDIYLPNLNIAFEFNGLYWHSELYKDKKYHAMKYDLCEEQNIQLIQIWEDDWNYKQDIVKSMILNKLKKNTIRIYARKTIIKDLSDKKYNKLIHNFLDDNHIQGFVGSSIKIGLFDSNDLVSLMIMKKRKNNNYELNRFCNKLNTNVIGGASKLFKYIIKKYDFNNIISFADRSFSNGDLYEKLDFDFNSIQISYWYSDNYNRYHKFKFRKEEKQKVLLKRKIYKIFTPGIIKYIYMSCD